MTSRAALLLSFLLGMVVTFGVMKVVGPTNFDDCLLRGLQGGSKSELEVVAVAGACRRKFPSTESVDTSPRRVQIDSSTLEHDLNPFEAALTLTGTGHPSSTGSFFWVHLHNGFDSVTITAVKITLMTKSGRDSTSQEYLTKVRIPPLTTTEFDFEVIPQGPSAKYEWWVSGARGFVNR